jgi:hypothetical protein
LVNAEQSVQTAVNTPIFEERKIKRGKNMNNKTIKRFDITIKLRGDNVYDLYFNDEWVSSRGSYNGILDDAKKVIENSYINE